MTRYQKEAISFSLLPLVAAVVYFCLSHKKYLVSFHDTYYTIDQIYMAAGVLISTGYICYLLRSFILKFRDRPSNIISIIYSILFIVLWVGLITLNERLSIDEGWAIYPPLSAPPVKIGVVYFIMKPVYMFILLVIFIIILAFSAFKTGKKFNRINNEN
jgi:hypothetical protein